MTFDPVAPVMGAGPAGRRIVVAPHHLPPSISLLNAADLAPLDADHGVDQYEMADGTKASVDHWLNGITYQPEVCTGGGAFAVQCPQSGDMTDNTNTPPVTTDAFVVWAMHHCSTLDWESQSYVERALDFLAAHEARLVEEEVWTGAAMRASTSSEQTSYLTNPTTCHVLNNGGAYAKASAGFAALQDALASCSSGGPGIIHANTDAPIARFSSPILRRDGNKLRDERDNLIVLGSGYDGSPPRDAGHTSGYPVSTPGVTTWIFATSMMRFWREQNPLVVPGNYAQALDRTDNTIRFYAQRAYLVDWDRCCHFAALVPLTD